MPILSAVNAPPAPNPGTALERSQVNGTGAAETFEAERMVAAHGPNHRGGPDADGDHSRDCKTKRVAHRSFSSTTKRGRERSTGPAAAR